MEKLNEYLQKLLSTCSEELHLEPDRNPYLVADNRTTDVSSTPMLGTQISMMVFPIIPAAVKTELPNSNEVEFEHPHALGAFHFRVRKSPAGFNVTICPMLSEHGEKARVNTQLPPEPPAAAEPASFIAPAAEYAPPAVSPLDALNIDSSSAGYEYNASIEIEAEPLQELVAEDPIPAASLKDADIPKVETVPANDPQFTTLFSDTSTYEPPGRRDELPTGDFEMPMDPYPVGSVGETYTDSTPEPSYSDPAPSSVSFNSPAVMEEPRNTSSMDALFWQMADQGASDLHLSVSMAPMIRKDGKMRILDPTALSLEESTMRSLLTSIMPKKNQEEFDQRHDTDFAYEIPGLARFRCNIFMDRKGMGAVFRIIPSKILTAEQLGLSKAVMDLCTLSKGLVVVTGPTGSGKSTTLCAMVDSINKEREDHIITIEDPIEFVHDNHKCLVNQREVHNHTDSFKDALRAALREDPDILLVGEMRDLETISIAIETAETGHLVFGTLHTTTAASTVDRIIDQFPADRQQQIRVMLSESLKGVIAQTLLPKKGGGRVAALEILIVTPAISNLIREGKTFQIPSAMQTGKSNGMVMLNDALFEHVKNGLVEPRDAYVKAVDKTGFESMLTKGGFKI